jgi:branched-chain amino acid transport system permease protein
MRSSSKTIKWLLLFVVVFSIVPFVIQNNYILHVFILFFMYTILATGWNILGGYAGQVSFGHSLFFGIGAYTSAILYMNGHVSPWLGMLLGMVISSVVAFLIGLPFFKLKGHYFAIATLAMGAIASTIGLNWEFIGASVGLYLPIEPSSFASFQFGNDKVPYYYIAMLFALIGLAISWWIHSNRPGYYFRAIRENGDAAASLGVGILKYKLIAFTISAVIVSMAGTFYAQYYLYINPEGVLSMDISIQMVLMAVLGGVGTVVGPVIGAAFLVPVSELIRATFGDGLVGIDQVIYALIIILVTTMQPNGIIAFFNRKKTRSNTMKNNSSTEHHNADVQMNQEVTAHE